jgi:multidrug efflux pump subunit AcrA (membrane-fusion protein)
MNPHRLAVYGLTAGLLGGGAAGLVLTGTSLASAQVSDVTGTVTDPATSDPSTNTNPAKGDWAKSVLDGLVAKGTITQAQADEVLAALNAARPAHGPGGRGHGPGFAKLDAAAQALGMSIEDLRSALQDGKSLATVAKEKGIDVNKVIDALVAEFKAHLDQEVASGIHSQAEADQKLADARSRIEAFVNGTAPAGGPGGFGGGRHGHGSGFGAPPPAGSAPAGGSTSGTTTS